MSNPSPVRVQAGVPNGGQFAPDQRPEGPPFDDDPNDPTPVSLTDLGIAVGDSKCVSDFETGDPMFDQLEITRSPEGFGVNGMVPIDLYGELTEGMDHTEAEQYLGDREPDINNFLRDRYDAELEVGNTEWEEQAVQFSTPMEPGATTADLLTALRDNTRAVDLHNDLSGAYDPSREALFPALRETLARQDIEREEAAGSYAAAAMWTAADENGENLDLTFEESDIDPASLAEQRAQLVDFMRANRGLLAQATALRPNFYDPSQVGHDFHLTRNGHGAGFWDRGLGQVGEQLSEAAKVYGSAELYPGDDGKLYFQ